MNTHATVPYIEVESSLAAVLARLDGHDDLPLSITYSDRAVQAGYHVTELKAARSRRWTVAATLMPGTKRYRR